jgi:hypothetical protein
MKYRDALVLICLLLASCRDTGHRPRTIHGMVTVGGQSVETGQIRFMPVGNDAIPANAAAIADGQFRVEGRGGLMAGRYRVELDARRKTGKKVRGFTGTEMGMMDETVRMGADSYSDARSPLIIEVTATGDEQIDIHIPAK